ncbi:MULTISPECIES: phenylacetic acid degradation protein PaaY [Marinobacter]|uniref:Phenylacetic acid degradation protein PaaY n=1 Tax=Marinobacter profundi TaxID=2666256 RepID=A0A2G1ULW2_9GAMM|nr:MULTISPECIES: phenylacetic acid degradation protein PaaY [Marinobacter]MBD3655926.1 phenylacetic acid degradation protein PaaY [Marinobacter sp.]PHQ15486.1 phenylacetic acid degradation protein PaaY [Marinobacter profundi]
MPSYSIEGVIPVVHPSAYVHPSAVLIGDVWIGADCYVGPAACLRGDFGRIVLKEGSNIQDTCVMHAFPGMDTVIEKNGHVGHGAILHGCIVGEDAMVGMNAVVMDEARIAPRSIVGAGALVKAKFSCEPGSLIVGSPAKVLRILSEQEIAWKKAGTEEYQRLTRRSLASLQECQPLSEGEQDRPRVDAGAYQPKHQS